MPAPAPEARDWAWYAQQPERRQAKARARLAALDAVEALVTGGLAVGDAVAQVARQAGCSASTLHGWRALVAGLARADWLPALTPRHLRRTATVDCDPRAWDMLRADYLRLEAPSFEACYRRAKAKADKEGWPMPSERTLHRRLTAEIAPAAIAQARGGERVADRLYPAQERDRTGFRALEAVNADGHKWDVFVRWSDGTVGRPVMITIQDLHSNKILGWRVDRTESADLARLAFRDVFAAHGIPDHCWLDNGRGFASKLITGGMASRFRFKVKPEEPEGVLTALGIKVHWTRPYSGQSKPIERAFRDFCDAIAKHPAFAGAYVGNKPDAKPENYGSKAIPIDDFLVVVAAGIAEHNARPGRRTRVCGGILSFDQAFQKSLESQSLPPRRASPEQLAMCLLVAESVRADRVSGSLSLLGNRYWGEFLHRHLGEAMVVRFDPDRLHEGVHVYRRDGRHVGHAECLEAAGFADVAAAKAHAAKRNAWKRATREAVRLEQRMSLDELVRLQAGIAPPEPPSKVVRLVHGTGALKAHPAEAPEAISNDRFERGLNVALSLVVAERQDKI